MVEGLKVFCGSNNNLWAVHEVCLKYVHSGQLLCAHTVAATVAPTKLKV